MSDRYVIEVDGLKKYFPLRDGLFGQQTGELRAVDGVSFNIRPGTIFGLVGESGSGKTTVGRTLLGLYEKSAGSVKFHGQELADPDRARPARHSAEDAAGISGSLQLAEPAAAYWRGDRRSHAAAQALHPR